MSKFESCRKLQKLVGVLLLVLLPVLGAHAQDQPPPRFDDAKRWAKTFDSPERDEWQMSGEIIAALKLKPDAVVVDIGAGTGYFSVRLAAAVPEGKVYAADISKGMFEHLTARVAEEGYTNIVPVLASRDSPNIPEPLDCVFLVNVQSLVMSPGDYFRNLASQLKPDARVAIISTRVDAERGARKPARRPPSHVKREMARQGFVLDEEHDFLKYQYFLIFKKRSAGE
jgi:cyclopropane fatty-acyl-phospholipid synthase-like methyltransferase